MGPVPLFIQRDGWRGIVIEPQKDVFENRLKVNYARNSNVRLMNVAVDAKDGSRPLYKYAFSTSRWATGLASFDRDRLIKTLSADWVQEHIREESITVSSNPDEYLTSELVPCASFETLLAEAGRGQTISPEADVLRFMGMGNSPDIRFRGISPLLSRQSNPTE